MAKLTRKKDQPAETPVLAHQFYVVKLDKYEAVKEVKVDLLELTRQLKSMGYARYDIDKNTNTLVHVNCSIVREVSQDVIFDEFEDLIKSLPPDGYGVDADWLLKVLYQGIDRYFSKSRLNRLRRDKPILFNRDTRDHAFFYFTNGFVKADEGTYELHDYTKMDRYVWKDQQIKFNFQALHFDAHANAMDLINPNFNKDEDNTLGKGGIYAQFLFHISGKNKERFESLLSIIGYNLHDCFEGKIKSTVFTDSQVNDENEGRTGKTLLGKCIGHVRNYVEINGKDFKTDAKEKYTTVNLDTQIIHINDLKSYFNVESLYNDITEGIEIKKLYMAPFKIQVKILLSTNKTLKIQGSSGRDRFIEFEFANYYSDTFSPQTEFGGWFFSEWDEEELNRFYNMQMYCAHYYLKNGLIQPENVNLKARKLLDHTSPEFLAWLDNEIKEGNIQLNQEYEKTLLYLSFRDSNIDYMNDKKFTQKRFTQWLKMWAQHDGKTVYERASNGKYYIEFVEGKK